MSIKSGAHPKGNNSIKNHFPKCSLNSFFETFLYGFTSFTASSIWLASLLRCNKMDATKTKKFDDNYYTWKNLPILQKFSNTFPVRDIV